VSLAVNVSLDTCATTRLKLEPPLHKTFRYQSPAERRRRRLKKGIDRWWQDTTERGSFTTAFLGEIDFAVDELDQTIGAIERFWHVFYLTYGRRLYFWWIELQARGVPQYHFVLIDPPWRMNRQWLAFYKKANPLGRHQPIAHWKTREWFVKDGGRYAKKYADKMAGPSASKAYQQRYEALPRALRTFGSSQLEFIVADLDEHRDRYDGAAINIWEEFRLGVIDWWCDQVLRHVRSRHGCAWQMRRRRGRARPPRAGPPSRVAVLKRKA